jgi:lysyl-tRNA synthetase class 1
VSVEAPEPIETLVRGFDAQQGPLEVSDVHAALSGACAALDPAVAEAPSGHADLLAMMLLPWGGAPSPWGGFFGPVGSFVLADGSAVHQPDLAAIQPDVVAFWRARADSLTHPALVARYADLVWDLAPAASAGAKRERAYGLAAADAHLAVAAQATDLDAAFRHARRSLSLSISLGDSGRLGAAKAQVLALHGRALADGTRQWFAFDILTEEKKAGLTDVERDLLLADLEAALTRYADTADPERFDPHMAGEVASRLIRQFRRDKDRDAEKSVHAMMARTTEFHAGLGTALLASSVLNDAMESYSRAGLPEEAERVRRLMALKTREANGEMKEYRHEVRIAFDDVDAFKAKIVHERPAETFAQIAVRFLLRRPELEAQVAAQETRAPLLASITQQIMDDDRVVATVGSVEDDPYGRLVREGWDVVQQDTVWLGWALEAAIESHQLHAGHFTLFANRAGLFEDGGLLAEGLSAWLDGDFVKAIHVLTPQVEKGLRNLIGAAGRPTTKPHPVFKTAQVAVTMGEAIYNKETVAALGPRGENLALHIATLYADPRGLNLRNDVAHGLLGPNDMREGVVLWLVHSLLVLGLWRAPAKPPSAGETPA